MAALETILVWCALIILCIGYYSVPYLITYSSLREIPAASRTAAFSNLWLAFQARRVRRSAAVHDAHQRLGPIVRIAPNHISIASTAAIHPIYGHGNGMMKSDFYDAFVSFERGLFSTRDRAEHTRKRKMVSHTFSAKAVGGFEQYIQQNLAVFVRQWNLKADNANGHFTKADALAWCNYLAFDMIGDLAFGQPFGMLEKGRDIAELQLEPNGPISHAPAVYLLDKRGELNAMLGCAPALIPYAKWIPDPFFYKGLSGRLGVNAIGTARVTERLQRGTKSDRIDLLARLMEGKDDMGNSLSRSELISEALTQMVAGSDTTANSLCAVIYWTLNSPGVQQRLQKELDVVIPEGGCAPRFSQVKDVKYLRAVINEGLRMHSTNSIGLAREVPPGPGLEILGHHFPAGTVLSVPTYSIHHSKEVWGEDADCFRPEKWEGLTEDQKTGFVPFSYGPRACVGRNVAEMEMVLIISTMFSRYDFELYQDQWKLRDGFLNKPVECRIGFKRRYR
ncbi:putative benzoate 4-monooxygenase [Exophiala viscosa]|uniref:putative benzoate 4-monooxygenase n=1 Tax=Exophiala viscosa TaxID=2486360 RepID=UPI00218D7511|nr:putative benzoate 4-monooxygenase [Exophiala viscosa]